MYLLAQVDIARVHALNVYFVSLEQLLLLLQFALLSDVDFELLTFGLFLSLVMLERERVSSLGFVELLIGVCWRIWVQDIIIVIDCLFHLDGRDLAGGAERFEWSLFGGYLFNIDLLS